MSTCLYPFHPEPPSRIHSLLASTPQRAMMANVRWPTGSTIRVGFLDRPDGWGQNLRRAAREAVAEWMLWANLDFTFGEGPADVSISFEPTAAAPYGTYSSLLGTDCLSAGQQGQASTYLVFDPDNPANTPEELRRVILHEFGHVLGLIHEHERPDSPVLWNQWAVWQYYRQLTDWSWPDIYQQVLAPYDRPVIAGTKFDPQSIMMYPVPPGLAQLPDGSPFTVGWNQELSDRDKALVRMMYP